MNTLIIFAIVLAVAAAAPQFGGKPSRGGAPAPVRGNPGQVSIRSQVDDIHPDGSYQYGFELDDGTSVQESGRIQNPTPEGGELVSSGSFSYVSPEGQQIKVTYVADGEGFKPQGDHLPVAPPIPEAIQKALAYIASQPDQKQKSG